MTAGEMDAKYRQSLVLRPGGGTLDTAFHLLLANLVERGVLVSGRHGYRLADPRILRLVELATTSDNPP